jgi:plastocyanin
MKSRTTVSILTTLALAALLSLSLAAFEGAHAASPSTSAAATVPTTYKITAGWGNDDYAANIYTPSTIHVYVGDTVTWRNNSLLEPHTISFGPASLLAQLAKNLVAAVPQKEGPPQLTINPQVAFATPLKAYSGKGFASSGMLNKGQSWSVRFTRPGKYAYYCLIHYPAMSGLVVVSPRPTTAHTYLVRSGYGGPTKSAVDAFFPENLRIHVGDTVRWSPGFHTVAFAPASEIQQLRQQFILPVPQKTGPPTLMVNPKTAFPSGGSTYDGTGFWNSGLLESGPTQLTFTKPGVYHYGCLIHPGMDGTITVLP